VSDTYNHRIQKFDSNGNYITQWGTYGNGDGEFKYPVGVAVDSLGNVYVSDFGNHRIQKFNSSGRFLTQWGTLGDGDGQFNSPNGVAIDSLGNVYVADENYRIQVFRDNDTTPEPIPEPSTVLLLMNGIIGRETNGLQYIKGERRIDYFIPSRSLWFT